MKASPPGARRRPLLAEILVEAQLISTQQLEQVRRAAQRGGSTVVATLIEQSIIDEEALVDALCRRLDLGLFDPTAEIDGDAIREVPHDQASRFRLLPVRLERRGTERWLVVAMADPVDRQAIEEIEFATGCRVEPLIARPSELTEAIRTHYRHLVTKVIPRSPAAATPRRRKRQPFGGDLLASDLRTKPVKRIQQEASPAHRVDAVVALLVRKGIISQDEYEEQLASIVHPGSDVEER